MSELYPDLSGCDLSGCDLSGSDLSGSDLSGSDLSGSDLSGYDANPPVQEAIETTELITSSDAQRLVESTWGLRLRSRIQTLGEECVRPLPPSFEQIANYKPTAERLNEMYFQSMIYLARFFMLTLNFLEATWAVVKKTSRAVRDSFRDDMYVFFEGSSYPYHLDDLVLSSPGVPPVEWYYNASTNTFVTARLQTNSQHYSTHHIPYLSAQIQYNDLTLYEISDFINSVRWAGEDGEPMPNVDHLVSAWTLSSGIVIQRSPAMKLLVINTDGNDAQISLRNQT
jgi:hypothetical protein